MIVATLAAATCAVLSPEVPKFRAEMYAPGQSAQVLVLSVEETHTVARNFTDLPQLLILGTEDLGPMASTWIQPGEHREFHHSPHVLDGLWFEVLSKDELCWTSSGAFPIRPVVKAQRWSFYITPEATYFGAHGPYATGPGMMVPMTSLLPAPFQQLATSKQDFHVPIPAPDDKPDGDTPPDLEKDPPPPI